MELVYGQPLKETSPDEEKIMVSVRLRPLSEKEILENDMSDWECLSNNTIVYKNAFCATDRSVYPSSYTFDRVFRPECSTQEVYEAGAKEVCLSVVNGMHSSVFAYGQTSSGKTYTMNGIVKLAVADIYGYMEGHTEREYIVKFSAMEIYNESVRDLLALDMAPLRLLDDPERGTVVERLKEEILRDRNHLNELLSICESQRQIGETEFNEASSRSHQILRLSLESCERNFLSDCKPSKLSASVNFVDLAGSERASQTISTGGRLKEGCHINRSLLTLGTVIRKLSKGRNSHIPYRDSKLTRILQASLGGNARTAVICTMSPARSHLEQSRNTLLFASCAKKVTTNAQVNVVVSDKVLINRLRRELARLENELRSSSPSSIASDSPCLLIEKDRQIEKLKKQVTELHQQLDQAQSQIEDLLLVSGDDSHSISVDRFQLYPKLKVRNSWRSENSVSYSPIHDDYHSMDAGVISLDASQFSDDLSSNGDDSFIQLSELTKNFLGANSSPDLSVGDKIKNDVLGFDDEEPDFNNHTLDPCKDLQCITVDPNVNKFSGPKVSDFSPKNCRDSSLSVEAEPASHAKEPEADTVISESVTPSPTRSPLCVLKQNDADLEHLKLLGSKSCEEINGSDSAAATRALENLEDATEVERAFYEVEKDESLIKLPRAASPSSPEGTKSAISKDQGTKKVQRNASLRSHVGGMASPDHTNLKPVKMAATQESGDLIQGNNMPQEMQTSMLPVGSQPTESAPKWPSDFQKLRREIIELWHTCHVSLVHRTYFFLLFKGDPADSFYMEVELRKLSVIKNMLSRGSNILINRQVTTVASSKRALNQERLMLSRRMQKKLSREEREKLFLKWGIPLNGNQRRLQLAHLLWTRTANMDHVTESATLIAKLLGFHEEQEQTLKETFALLSLTPKRQSRKSSLWKWSKLSLF